MLTLDTEHKKHLKLLSEQPTNVVQDFCKLASDFLQKGHNYKLYNAAAQKLDVESESIKQCIEGLVYLLLESIKNKLSTESFHEFVTSIGFNDKKDELLMNMYETMQPEINERLKNIGFKLPTYHNMEWRFEVQVASRSMLSQLEPLVTMDFVLKDINESNKMQHVILQSDATNIIHLTQELDAALQQGKSQHIRKISRIGGRQQS